MSVNKVILVGNLGRDPEVRTTQTGSKIVSFTLATSESWRDRQSGERREKTEWHRVVIFNSTLAELAERYLHKGSKVYLEGSLQTRKWTDQSGQERQAIEVVLPNFRGALKFLDSRNSGDGQHTHENHGQPHNGQPHNGQPHNGQSHNGQSHNGQPHSGPPHQAVKDPWNEAGWDMPGADFNPSF